MRFHEYPAKTWTEILPGASASTVDLVRRTVRYETTQRLTAEEVSSATISALEAAEHRQALRQDLLQEA